MGNFRPSCIASNGERLYLVSLQPLSANSTSDTNPALGYTRRIILLQSQLYPESLKTTSWTIVSSYPPYNSTSQTNELDTLVGDFASGTSNCQVDDKGNFVWISSKSVVKNTSKPSVEQITSKTSGVRYSVDTVEGGAWSRIETSRQPGSQGIDYIWNDEGKVNALFSIAQGVFIHAIASSTIPGITFSILSDNNLVQSNRSWSLDAAIYGIPKAIAYGNNTIYLLGSNKMLSLLPVNTSTRDIASLDSYQQSQIKMANIKQFSLATLSDDCLNPQLTTLYSTSIGHTVYFLCSSASSTTTHRLFAYDEVILKGPFKIPSTENQGTISTFVATSGPSTDPSGSNFLFTYMDDNILKMTAGVSGLYLDTAIFDISDATPNIFTTLPGPLLTSPGPLTTSSGPLPTSSGLLLTSPGPSSTSPVPPPISPDPSPTSASQSNGNKSSSGGITGGVIAAVCVFIALFFRFIRKRRRENIDEITRKFDGQQIVSPDQPHYAPHPDIIMPAPRQPSSSPPSVNFSPMVTEEQQDQAQIELQRWRLGPAPLIVAGATPIAPPSFATISEDPQMSIPNQPYTATTSASAPDAPMNQYKYPPYQHNSSTNQHFYHESSPENDYKNPFSESSSNLISKTPMQHHESLSGIQSEYPHNQPSSSSTSHKEKSFKDESDNPRSPPPPPPPYLAKATQLLNSPSAPSPYNEQSHTDDGV
ncbi:hypothetical protein BGZ49_001542 [Haplosporangium sp. Z 27]|nr:hypothetical protein BGZ49_001542 [Haplosporangium sp. Z 27]